MSRVAFAEVEMKILPGKLCTTFSVKAIYQHCCGSPTGVRKFVIHDHNLISEAYRSEDAFNYNDHSGQQACQNFVLK